jgi:hypothetical protein
MTNPMKYELIREADWISGTTQEDEKFIGFVQSMKEDGALRVWVTQSDREAIVGSTIHSKLAKVRKLPDPTLSSEGEVKSLIELALDTHDKEWFEQLRAELAILSTVVRTSNGASRITKLKERF